MFCKKISLTALLSLAASVSAHYTFPDLIVNGVNTGDWVNIRRTNNYNSQAPVTDVTSADFRCYTSQTGATASTANVAAGSTIGIGADQSVYHPGVVNVYMAKAPGNVTTFDGSGAVWFKVFQISAVTDGGKTITFPGQNINAVTFTIPKNLPSGQYLVRAEQIALHAASTFGGAQFYLSCAQINVTGGGSGTPGPLVSIPGVYTGKEPGIMLNIYYPIPTTYVQPGPAVWNTFPDLLLNGVSTGDWVNVRKTNNFNTQSPVTDVTSADFRCYTSQTGATASTATVAAGSKIGIGADGPMYHPGVVNVYMAKAPSNATTFDGSGSVWFKVYQISAVTDGGSTITFPAQNLNSVSFTIPKNLPTGQYLVRMEQIALHAASTFQGAQFYLSCAQINVTGGGSGTPGPLVAIPGVYTGKEPGIMLNIYYRRFHFVSSLSTLTKLFNSCPCYLRTAWSLATMFSKQLILSFLVSSATLVSAHYTFPTLLINGVGTGNWVNVRRTNNFNTRSPVTDVSSQDIRCYTSETRATAQTATVTAGSQIGFRADEPIYHAGVLNIYMAKAPGSAASFDGSGNVWFKVHQISAVTDGGKTISFPSSNLQDVTFTIPKSIPSGEYLVRVEHIALHSASSFQGAQFYISCAQINVTGGGNGSPGPLVSFPGAYSGRESGIQLNIYYPVPATYVQPGPVRFHTVFAVILIGSYPLRLTGCLEWMKAFRIYKFWRTPRNALLCFALKQIATILCPQLNHLFQAKGRDFDLTCILRTESLLSVWTVF
ncbi:hypothetical protein CVT25_006839 [Psilocybe cyanescens]|uniref:lytic cellulose monooxygenase (C4-dehydrogenating) n=1 Tax=Psilocybe cyanescens TaxID=93625 RepID=A0A409X7E3_PSICY|nr:hypothetical protein CVT25_006839 [Psilocybe cyanescens]